MPLHSDMETTATQAQPGHLAGRWNGMQEEKSAGEQKMERNPTIHRDGIT
jgi:hypothetical protein